MSTTAAFVFGASFPWCVGDESGLGLAYIGNLTLTQVMAFAWSLETFTLTTSGSATKGAASIDSAGTITSNPVGATLFNRGSGGGMWLPSTAANTAWASWAGPKVPRDRVCSSTTDLICSFLGNNSSAPSENFFSLFFYVGTDLINAGKYRIYYVINIAVTGRSSPSNSVQIIFVDPTTGSGATLWNSGTITIGGITFSWESHYTTGATPSGAGTLAASSSNYTYA